MAQPNLAEYTKKLLSLIAKHYELDVADLSALVNAELQQEIMGVQQNDVSKFCCAYVKTNGKICQCSRGKKQGQFCVTHAGQHAAGTLKFGFKKETTTVVEMEKITIKNSQYLYHTQTNKVFNIKTNALVGYLREDDDTHELFIEDIEQ